MFLINDEYMSCHESNHVFFAVCCIRPDFFYLLIYGNFFSDLGSGDEKK